MEIYENKNNDTNTIISKNGPNWNDIFLTRLIKTQDDLAIIAYLKTLGEANKLAPRMTSKQLSDLCGGTPKGRKISDILRTLGVSQTTKKTSAGYQFYMRDFMSFVALTSLPAYSLDDLRTAKAPVLVDMNTGFSPTYISSMKRFKSPASEDDPIIDHPYYDAAVRLFKERYDKDFYAHLNLYHFILDRCVLTAAPEHMHGYCLKYEGGTADSHGYRTISSFYYKNKHNPEGPDLHSAQAHRIVSLVHHFEYDFGGKAEHRHYDVHHLCEVANCCSPLHLMPLNKLAHQQFHRDKLLDSHPFNTDPSNGFQTAIYASNGHADISSHASIH